MSVTPEQLRTQIIADIDRIRGIGLLWNRMSALQQQMSLAARALATENGPAMQGYLVALAAKVNTGLRTAEIIGSVAVTNRSPRRGGPLRRVLDFVLRLVKRVVP